MKDEFYGPLFIVGLPRSGKKLLRDLLNENPIIGIPIMETSFIPYMIDLFGRPPRFDDEYEFDHFYKEFTQSDFYWFFARVGRVLSKEDLGSGVEKTSWRSIFEFILKSYAPEGRSENFIWGEKTPAYLLHMPLLKELYPEARFLHVIRDPRDHSHSCKKVFGKSLLRAAEVWREEVNAARVDSLQLGADYMEVFYESLLIDPEKVLSNVCEFLGCAFVPSMTRLTRAPEGFGDTGGQVRIVSDNRNKYLTQLTPSQVMRIEEIVCPVATATGYELENDVEFKPVEPNMLKMLTLYDGWASLKFTVFQYGLRQGFRMFFRWHTRGSWVALHFKSIRNILGFSIRGQS